MISNSVCAIVVSFHPSAEVLQNLTAICGQVQHLVVVDNGSSEEVLAPLVRAQGELGFTLIRNGTNLGIAAALNHGLREALAGGFEYILFFDQDSRVTEGFVGSMLETFAESGADVPVGVVCPKYIDRVTMKERPEMNLDRDGGPLTCMTSGSMSQAQLFRQLGGFVEELFIYCVDDEFCLRARAAGYTIRRSPAVLLHSEGNARFVKFLGQQFYLTQQKPNRRYYITRNQLWVREKYPTKYPADRPTLVNVLMLCKSYARTLLLENQKLRKAGAMLYGMRDFLRGRMGKTLEL